MSPVLKTNGSRGPAYGDQVTAYRLEDVSEKAREFLDQAQSQAAQIIAQAREQAQQIRAQAEQQGHAAARTTAESKVDERLKQSVQTLSGVLRDLGHAVQESHAAWLQRWEQGAVQLAIAIAGRILRSPLTQSPEVRLDLIREALELASGNTQIMLHVCPQDQPIIEPHLPEFLARLPQVANLKLVADASVSSGGCVVRTEFGTIDQTYEAQLARIEQEFMHEQQQP